MRLKLCYTLSLAGNLSYPNNSHPASFDPSGERLNFYKINWILMFLPCSLPLSSIYYASNEGKWEWSCSLLPKLTGIHSLQITLRVFSNYLISGSVKNISQLVELYRRAEGQCSHSMILVFLLLDWCSNSANAYKWNWSIWLKRMIDMFIVCVSSSNKSIFMTWFWMETNWKRGKTPCIVKEIDEGESILWSEHIGLCLQLFA